MKSIAIYLMADVKAYIYRIKSYDIIYIIGSSNDIAAPKLSLEVPYFDTIRLVCA
jgi:hypothetical protein